MSDASAPAARYSVELLYEFSPVFSRAEALIALRDRCGAAAPVDPDSPDSFNFYFPDIRVPCKGGDLPVQCVLEAKDEPLPDPVVDASLAQTRDWGEARAVVEGHLAQVVVSDLLAASMPYKGRLRLFRDVVLSIVELAAPVAVHWRPAQKFFKPLSLGKAWKTDPSFGAFNVRRLKKGEDVVMDTMGLAALGLPDFECIPGPRDPAKVRAWLHALGKYVFDLGDVIEPGRVVKGPDGVERFDGVRARSTLAPDRAVVSLRPAP
jgi:hypothetical protein